MKISRTTYKTEATTRTIEIDDALVSEINSIIQERRHKSSHNLFYPLTKENIEVIYSSHLSTDQLPSQNVILKITKDGDESQRVRINGFVSAYIERKLQMMDGDKEQFLLNTEYKIIE